MRYLNNHLGMVLALIAFLFSYEFYKVTTNLTQQYKAKINNNYSIVISSISKQDPKVIKKYIPLIKEIKPITTKKIIDELKDQISQSNLALLKVSLPFFYEIHLKILPSTKELKQIKKKLIMANGILKVETFTKSYENIYNLLMFFEYIAQIFLTIVVSISFLLIIKQSTLWQHKHSQMILVLSYFGAPSWMRNGGLIKNAVIDSFIAALISAILVYFIYNSTYVITLFDSLDIGQNIINYKTIFFEFLAVCLGISMITVILAVYRIKD